MVRGVKICFFLIFGQNTFDIIFHPMRSSRTITILATILAMLVSEYLFHFPSRVLHDGGTPPVNIVISPGSVISDVTPSDNISTKNTIYCTAEYAPVCWSDAITYPNACEASRSKVAVAYSGTCDDRKVSPIYEEVSTASGSTSSLDTLSGQTVDLGDSTDTGSLSLVSDSSLSGSTSEYSTGTHHIYWNNSLQYGFALPKYTYYQGQWAQWGALHTMAVGLSSTGSASLETADVKVYYYRSVPGTAPEWEKVDLGDAVVIISWDTSNARISTIIDTIKKSLRKEPF